MTQQKDLGEKVAGLLGRLSSAERDQILLIGALETLDDIASGIEPIAAERARGHAAHIRSMQLGEG